MSFWACWTMDHGVFVTQRHPILAVQHIIFTWHCLETCYLIMGTRIVFILSMFILHRWLCFRKCLLSSLDSWAQLGFSSYCSHHTAHHCDLSLGTIGTSICSRSEHIKCNHVLYNSFRITSTCTTNVLISSFNWQKYIWWRTPSSSWQLHIETPSSSWQLHIWINLNEMKLLLANMTTYMGPFTNDVATLNNQR